MIILSEPNKNKSRNEYPCGFCIKYKMTEEKEDKTMTMEKHPGSVAQGHKLAALMKKRKEEILHNKEQSTEQYKEQPTEKSKEHSMEQSSAQSSARSTEQSSVRPMAQSNDTYVHGVGMLVVLAIGICVFFKYNKKDHEEPIKPKGRHML